MSDINSDKKVKEIKGAFNKKLRLLFGVILVALLLGAVVIGASFIFSKNISGAWELVENPEVMVATADEITDGNSVYYVFDKPDRYGRGKYSTFYQGGVEQYNFELLEEDSVEKINLGTENMEYKITGSKLLGNAKLTIIYPEHTDEMTGLKTEASKYVFKQAEEPSYEKQSFEDFDVDKSLIGTWINNERTLSYYQYTYTYEQSVEIKDNGIMIIRYKSEELLLDRYMYYAYTADSSKLTFSLVTDKNTKYTVPYGIDEKGNLKFTNDDTTASIFADAFFGDSTFYKEENIPGITATSTD